MKKMGTVIRIENGRDTYYSKKRADVNVRHFLTLLLSERHSYNESYLINS